jgi:hypothetical protein
MRTNVLFIDCEYFLVNIFILKNINTFYKELKIRPLAQSGRFMAVFGGFGE